MAEFDRSALISQWWRELAAAPGVRMPPPDAEPPLGNLLDDFAAALAAEPFDPTAGIGIGQTLAGFDIGGDDVPVISAQVLWQVAAPDPGSHADQRRVMLLAALGQGFQAATHRTDPAEAARRAVRQAGDERFRLIFDHIAVAVAIGDTEGMLIDANQALADMLGVTVEDLRGIPIDRFAHPDDVQDILALIEGKLIPAREGTVQMEYRSMRSDGTIGWAAFSITYVPGTDGRADYLLAIGADVTERHRLQEELHSQARHDPLTGLPNRRHLLERIETLAATSREDDRVGLCFVDLDRFKDINDRYGHRVGDLALRAVAGRIRESLAEEDCTATRLGGDEFVVLIAPPADDRRVAAVVEAILSALRTPIVIDEHRLHISASVGAVVASIADARTETLLDAADQELYQAKARGKARNEQGEEQWVLHDRNES